MTIIGIDDTDSAEKGMCTTYIGHLIATELSEQHNATADAYLVRLNPCAKHKTRGNAAVAVHTDCALQTAMEVTHRFVRRHSRPSDPETNPGAVVVDEPPESDSDRINNLGNFTKRAMHELLSINTAESVIDEYGVKTIITQGNGRGRIGATAAIAAHTVFDDLTYESISYRKKENWGESRTVNTDTVATAHNQLYPSIWDNFDPKTGEAVCVPHTPCPVLFGIRGNSRTAVSNATEMIDSEPTTGSQVFITNQGTDAHIKTTNPETIEQNISYSLTAEVISEPTTKEGGHVFFTISTDSDETTNIDSLPQPDHTVEVAAFEPTKRFRDTVRNLREQDVITVWGEYSDDILKLEKFSVDSLNTTKLENPTCGKCEKSMASMGADQGYRCSSCKDTVESKQEITVDRNLTTGDFYEVPPVARRHLAKPTVLML